MMKRWIKIIILFVLIVIILIGGWGMYKALEYNKQSFSVDIYKYISPQATEVININKGYTLNDLYIYDSSFAGLIKVLDNDITYPVVICKFKDGKKYFGHKSKTGTGE